MKTRIKEVVLKNGTSVFYGQYRRFGIWWYFGCFDKWLFKAHEYKAIEVAMRRIDLYRADKSAIQGQKKAKTVYHRYP